MNQKQKVSIMVARRVGDDCDAFFIGFISVRGGTEYLMIDKNGEAEPEEKTYQISNRHGIESFDLKKEGMEWFAELKIKSPNFSLS